ncbi:hypothetical protein C7N83_07830 [Neisseria iguanae]|uniref:Tc1-like transposase DDE domain-containing protein n=1 Tax=Neisseria iguanae TaxID=90242 RepID=A0A2P7TZP1_9NEIS|nr:hypothetical protein C7N83_07830 [Neisseria iguanae]
MLTIFEAWFEKHLLPSPSGQSVIIMDNARFSRMGSLQEPAQSFGHIILPLPPYSPDLNPIGKTWGNIKKHLRKALPVYETFGWGFAVLVPSLISYKLNSDRYVIKACFCKRFKLIGLKPGIFGYS